MGFFAKALAAMRHGTGWSWFTREALAARKRFDYAGDVGLGLEASVVMAPVQWLQRNLPSAPIAIERREGSGQRLPNHRLAQLLERPNAGYSGAQLLVGTVFSLALGGNGYWIKIRNGTGRVVELWYAPHWLMKPRWPQDGSEFISRYDYSPTGTPIPLEVNDVVHFRMGMDPRNPRLGLSPIASVLREIWSDMEIGTFVASLLRNSGVPGLVISPDGPVAARPDDVDSVKRYLADQFTGEKRGMPLVLSAKTKVEKVGWNPKELDLSSASDRAEERVCALLGIPPVVVGFHAGSSQTSVGATMHEQVRMGWHNAVLPMQGLIAEEIERALLPDFESSPERLAVYFDTSEVEALQEEADKLVGRAERLFKASIVTQGEARQMIGMPADERHNIYLRQFGVVEVPGKTNRAPQQDLPALRAGPELEAKAHVHSGLEERIANDAPHAELSAEQASFIADIEAASVRLGAKFEKTLHAFFRSMGEEAATATEEALAELAKAAAPRKKGTRPKALKDEALNLMVTDRVVEAMALPQKQQLFREHYQRHFLDVARSVASAAGQVGLGTDLPDRVGRAVIATGGTRAGLVDLAAQTRDAVLRTVAEGRAAGDGAEAIARSIRDQVPAGPWSDARVRARVIARTETKFAQNVSVLEHSRANGVQRFIVSDARLGATDPVCEAMDGAIVTAEQVQELAASEHPNGTRSFSPYFG